MLPQECTGSTVFRCFRLRGFDVDTDGGIAERLGFFAGDQGNDRYFATNGREINF